MVLMLPHCMTIALTRRCSPLVAALFHCVVLKAIAALAGPPLGPPSLARALGTGTTFFVLGCWRNLPFFSWCTHGRELLNSIVAREEPDWDRNRQLVSRLTTFQVDALDPACRLSRLPASRLLQSHSES